MPSKTTLNKRLSKVRATKRELGIKIGRMAITPRSSPSYSSTKMENMQRDMDALKDEESDILGQLLEMEGGETNVISLSKVEPEPVIKVPDSDHDIGTKKAS
jgi:hypothetical protein